MVTMYKEKTDLSANALKNIALIMMVVDHYVAGFVPIEAAIYPWLRVPGRIVAPIFCYMIAEGFYHTHDVRRYIKRLFILALISHFPYVIYFDLPWWQATSIIWPLVLGLLALLAVKNEQFNWPMKIGIVLLCCALAYNANWNFIAVLWILFFGLFHGNFKKQILAFLAIGLFLHAGRLIFLYGWIYSYQLAIVLAIPLLALYKGRRGSNSTLMKWNFYASYPLHLLVLYLLRILVG